ACTTASSDDLVDDPTSSICLYTWLLDIVRLPQESSGKPGRRAAGPDCPAGANHCGTAWRACLCANAMPAHAGMREPVRGWVLIGDVGSPKIDEPVPNVEATRAQSQRRRGSPQPFH